METKELLNKVAGHNFIIEILYENSSGITNRHILDCVDLKVNNRSTAFEAYSSNAGKVLKFIVSKIKNIKVLTFENTPSLTFGKGYRRWTYIFSQDLRCEADGIYIIACRGDNHLIFELYKLDKKSCFLDYYSGSNTHYNGWMTVDPLAYHYIPPYKSNVEESDESPDGWRPFDLNHNKPNECLAPHSGIYVRTYEIEGIEISNIQKNCALYVQDTFESIADLSSGINYDYIILNRDDEILRDHEDWDSGEYDFHIEIENKKFIKKYLGYICISKFTEDDHCNYWTLSNSLNEASKEKTEIENK